jgi:uncharacterized protein (TIGR00375 family)
MPRVIADLHIHSRYSRATSTQITVEELAKWGKIKGLTLIGTGDFTHPKWLKELKEALEEVPGTNLYALRKTPDSKVWFMVTGEVSTVFEHAGKTKKIHHVLLTPSLEDAELVMNALSKYGDLGADGRPTLKVTASEFVERILEASPQTAVIPAHAWTPWFSLFGDKSGFDRLEECYGDMSSRIFALETGLSSDPPMNWRLSALDKYALVSNSDSHSFWPWRLGREANVFDLPKVTYGGIIDALRAKDPKRFRATIEVEPAYGKYHWTGHRACGVSMPPEEAIRLGNLCPKCGKPLIIGVDQRVEELADRPKGYRPGGVVGYVHLLPLHEVIASVLGTSNPNGKEVWSMYNHLIQAFGNELSVLLSVPYQKLVEEGGRALARAILDLRLDQVKVVPGYDGVYGQPVFKNSSRETH